jgi:hypothetical protein
VTSGLLLNPQTKKGRGRRRSKVSDKETAPIAWLIFGKYYGWKFVKAESHCWKGEICLGWMLVGWQRGGTPQTEGTLTDGEIDGRFEEMAKDEKYLAESDNIAKQFAFAEECQRKIDGKFSAKYEISGGQIVNTVSGEVIPEDEPLFLLRGRDHNAYDAVLNYLQLCIKDGCNDLHLAGIRQTVEKFIQFRQEHHERMKQPGITKHLELEATPEGTPTPAVLASLKEFLALRQAMIDVGGTEGPLDQEMITRLAEMQCGVVDRAKAAIAEVENAPQGTPTNKIVQPTTNPARRSRCCNAPIIENDDALCTACGYPTSAIPAECPQCGSKDFWTVLPACHGGKAHKWHRKENL